jgi:probable rRNA maturation factor
MYWFKQRRAMKACIHELFSLEGILLGELNIIFCDDEFLLGINREYLQHEDYTDIITFDLSDSSLIKGEIYISIPRIMENASNLHLPNQLELRRVIFHGCLHLCGYKDKLKQEKEDMRRQEDRYLSLYSSWCST